MPTRATERINFGKIKEIIAPPNLIELQTNSYKDFLQAEASPSKRKNLGLQAVFTEVFPIESYDGKCVLDFHSYEIGEPKVDWLECLREGLDLRRAALRHLPAQGGKGDQRGKGVHGRTAAHDPAGHLRHQRRRARHRQPVAPLARAGLRGDPASQRQDAAFLPHHSRTAVPGTRRSSTPAICSTCIWTGRSAAGSS